MRLLIILLVGLVFSNFGNRSDDFLMPVEDVFSISGRGTVVSGVIERGKIKIGDSVEFVGLSAKSLKGKVTGIESVGSMLKEATTSQQVGLIISGVDKNSIQRGMVAAALKTIKAYTEFNAQLYLFTKAEGGRTTAISDKYKPQFYFRTAAVSGEVSLPANTRI